jgi:hypothetical protein
VVLGGETSAEIDAVVTTTNTQKKRTLIMARLYVKKYHIKVLWFVFR